MNKQKMYEKYCKLIYKVMKDVGCEYNNQDEFQEYFDAGSLGLLNAINSYNDELDETTTYFYNCIKNAILKKFKYNSSKDRKLRKYLTTSLDKEVLEEKDLIDMIPDETIDLEKELLKEEELNILYKAIDMLKPTYKKLICDMYGLKTSQLNMRELTKKYQMTKQNIYLKKKLILRDLRKNMKKLGGINIE